MRAQRRRLPLAIGVALAALAAAVPVTLAAPGAPAAVTVVARGLNNPRQLAWAGDGQTLLVAEAGRGGTSTCQPLVGPFHPLCAGRSGAVTAIADPGGSPTRSRLAGAFISQAEQDTGLDATGLSGIAVLDGRTVLALGRHRAEAAFVHSQAPAVVHASAPGQTTLATFRAVRDPGQLTVAAKRLFLTDRGSGTLWRLGAGAPAPHTRFDPDREVLDAVTTGPDAKLHLATSIGSATGTGYDLRWRIWRVDPRTGERVVRRTGAGVLTGLAFGPDGSLWVAGRAPRTGAGFVTRYPADGLRAASYPVPDPGGIAVAQDGRAYVAAYSHHDEDGYGLTSNSGRVLRLHPDGAVATFRPAVAAQRAAAPGALGTPAEGFSPHLPQVSCDPVAKPGVAAFRAMVLSTYGRGRDGGIIRECHIGAASHHKEGRAWDWMLDLAVPAERRAGAHLLDWLLADDALAARRLGINNLIWQRHIWYSYRTDEGWQPYTGPNPHLDHIHASFSWTGAMRRSSFWTGQAAAEEYGPCRPASGQLAPPYGSGVNPTPCPELTPPMVGGLTHPDEQPAEDWPRPKKHRQRASP